MFSGTRRSLDLWELVHPVGVHVFANHPVQLALKRADSPVHVDELTLVAVAHARAKWQRRPTASQANHSDKPRFVLEDQTNGAAFDICWVQDGRQRFGKFFSQSSCSLGSLFGCRVSGDIFSQPCSASKQVN